MSWTDDQPPGLLAAANQELAGLRGWIRELATEHPHVKEHVGAMEALFTLAKHIENAVDTRPGMPNAWLIAAAAVDMLTATQADADKWERRYAEMLAQRDIALRAAGQTQGVVAAARAAVASILELHPQIREAHPAWFHDSTLQLVAAIDALGPGGGPTATFLKPAICGRGCATWCATGDACPLGEGAQLYEPDSCPGGGPTCVFYPTRHVHPVEPPAGGGRVMDTSPIHYKDPAFVPKVVRALLDPANQINDDGDTGCSCHINPPCSWCTSQCCGEHADGCQAPAYPCCDNCPDAGD